MEEKVVYFISEYKAWLLSNPSVRESMVVDGKRYVLASESEIKGYRPKLRIVRNLHRPSDNVSVKICI